MNSHHLLAFGAFYNLAFAIFHTFFWKLFGWRETLAPLTPINRSVMQILNLCLIFVFVVFAYVSAFHTGELLATNLGRTLLFSIALFWLLRAAEQMIFFGLKAKFSLALFGAFSVGSILYLIPALS